MRRPVQPGDHFGDGGLVFRGRSSLGIISGTVGFSRDAFRDGGLLWGCFPGRYASRGMISGTVGFSGDDFWDGGLLRG